MAETDLCRHHDGSEPGGFARACGFVHVRGCERVSERGRGLERD